MYPTYSSSDQQQLEAAKKPRAGRFEVSLGGCNKIELLENWKEWREYDDGKTDKNWMKVTRMEGKWREWRENDDGITEEWRESDENGGKMTMGELNKIMMGELKDGGKVTRMEGKWWCENWQEWKESDENRGEIVMRDLIRKGKI